MDLKPYQIVSLWDMQQFFAGKFLHAYQKVGEQLDLVTKIYERRGNSSHLKKAEAQFLMEVLEMFKEQCEESKLDRTLARFDRLKWFKDDPESFDVETLKWELKELLRAAFEDVSFKRFFVVNEAAVKHFNLKNPFGEAVYNAFESARHDAREAKNCHVLDRHTACVFHCMRVLEKGLHALVHHLNSKHSAGIVFSKTVEESNWGNIITEIQNTLTRPGRFSSMTPQPTKEEQTFYSQTAVEFEHFKDAWRDDVSHSRRSYDESSAKSVLEHVETFMRKIVDGGLKE